MEAIVLSTKEDREIIIELLHERDGSLCMLPTCRGPFSEDNLETLDHIYPQYLAKADGWTYEQINDINNLQLMHKACNAKKGHLLPDEEGNFPFKEREPRVIRGPRPQLCETCMSGRLLLPGENCEDCGIGPQPAKYPGTLQRKPKECDHSTYHCVRCIVWEPEVRVPAMTRIIGGP